MKSSAGTVIDIEKSSDESSTNDKIETEETVLSDISKITTTIKCEGCEIGIDQCNLIQSEIEKFMKTQDAGLDTSFKCPKCRSCKECLKGPGQEKLSMQQEAEQEVIKDSVSIDFESGTAIASLAFTADPEKHLKSNSHIAVKRLQNVCKKYAVNPDVKETIIKGFQKLIDRGHILPWSKLSEEQRADINNAKASYTIPWDVGFKEASLSTPARPTFDASSRTSGGFSLNDILAKGNANLVNLVSMVLDWVIGPSALTGDIS